ncbi:MAG: amidophosphoribosyltransferase [Candidatus Peregrinibacteria bacterium GW2011_GWC2_39_14]|nr:MAG: Phosphoribosyl transferase domain protein [Candidatus Peregrinibacteria bacterium GW2011_GWA2_38_36]KKR05038.1 MAG: amidophosphoribosyltransferase [Candidatus Peregrinibacteria bacterium GW2011_GWC2_39_14]
MYILNFLNKFLTFCLGILFPVLCVACGKEGGYLCKNCLPKIWNKRCKYRISTKGGIHLDGSFFVFEYEKNSAVLKLIQKLKYTFSTEIAEILSEFLYAQFEDVLTEIQKSQNWAITFVPIYRKRFLWRGFNQAELIARIIAYKSGIPMHQYLVKTKNTATQVGLDSIGRIINLRGAFCVTREVRKNVILIDDVLTTGATMNECAKVLKRAGAEKVYGMVLCKRV